MDGAETEILGYGMEMAVGLPTSSCLTGLRPRWLAGMEVAYMGGLGWEEVCAAAHGSVK